MDKNTVSKIEKLISSSRKVIKECSLTNGGILAANTTKTNYPATAKNYNYVWIRDASYACLAADILGITDIQDKFFEWCINRAEGFNETGIIYGKYSPNGLKATSQLQPDQAGILLFAVWHHIQYSQSSNENYKVLVNKAADGICSIWDKKHFKHITNDIWEERYCFPDLKENFSYSLASCIKGLKCTSILFENKRWEKVADDMKEALDENYTEYFIRSSGMIKDKAIDASLMGLLYPFDIYKSRDERMINTLNIIERKLTVNGGVHRYEHDNYDGWIYNGLHRNKGAGAWVLLNFWLSICFSIIGEKQKAEKYYYWVLEKIKASNYLPEQIFENELQTSVSPLLWSHAMFVIASHKLGLLETNKK